MSVTAPHLVANSGSASELETAAPVVRRMTFKPAASVQVVRPEFLWHRWLVRGGLHLLIGRQGLGKSTFVAYVAAHVNIGLPLPGDDGPHGPGIVAMLSLEEPDDRLVARMVAAGADLERVLILGDVADVDDDGRSYLRPWRLPVDCGVLEQLIVEHHVDLVTIDGLGYSVGGDSHNYANVGAALSALAGVAERTGCSIVGLTHPPKGGAEAVTAAIGSTAWTSVPRICWVLGKDPDDDSGQRRVVNVSKSNFKLPEAGLSFTIADDQERACGYVAGVGKSLVDPDALTAASESPEDRSEQAEIVEMLRELTAEKPIPVDEVRKALKSAGYDPAERSLRRARARAGLVVIPPARFGGRRSFGRPEHLEQSGHTSPANPSSSDLAGLWPDDTHREYMPSNASPANPAEDRAALSALGEEQ